MLYLVGFGAGVVLGILFFAGLYWSTKKLPEVKHPGLLMLTSGVLRMGLLIVAFYGLSQLGAPVMVVALLGVVMVRIVMTRYQKGKLVHQKNGEELE